MQVALKEFKKNIKKHKATRNLGGDTMVRALRVVANAVCS